MLFHYPFDEYILRGTTEKNNSMDNNFNPDKQHTLSSAVSISGTGLHTGVLVDMTLKPANPGLVFSFSAWIWQVSPSLKLIVTS